MLALSATQAHPALYHTPTQPQTPPCPKARAFTFAILFLCQVDLPRGHLQAKDRGLAQRVRRLAADVGVTVEEVDKHHLNLLSGNRPHQGVAADVGPLEVAQLTQAPGEQCAWLF